MYRLVAWMVGWFWHEKILKRKVRRNSSRDLSTLSVLVTCKAVARRINIGIKHGFSCINVCQVPREVLKTEAEGRGFQHLPRDLANVNVLENHV